MNNHPTKKYNILLEAYWIVAVIEDKPNRDALQMKKWNNIYCSKIPYPDNYRISSLTESLSNLVLKTVKK